MGLAFGAGMLATVSPCGLAMLPGFLAYYIGTDDAAAADAGRGNLLLRRSVSALRTGLVVSVGFATVFIVTGLVVTAGLRGVVDAVPWVAVIVGVVLVAAGLFMVAGRRVAVTLRFNPLRSGGRGPIAMLAYGAAYAVAALTCSLGVLLALIGGGLSASNATDLVRVFSAFAAGSATILVLLSLSAGLAGGGLARVLRESSQYLTQVAGVVVVLSGIYMIVYWLPALSGGDSNRGLAAKVMPITGAIHDTFEAHTTSLGIIAISAVVVIVAWAVRGSRRQSSDVDERDDATTSELTNTR